MATFDNGSSITATPKSIFQGGSIQLGFDISFSDNPPATMDIVYDISDSVNTVFTENNATILTHTMTGLQKGHNTFPNEKTIQFKGVAPDQFTLIITCKTTTDEFPRQFSISILSTAAATSLTAFHEETMRMVDEKIGKGIGRLKLAGKTKAPKKNSHRKKSSKK